MRALALALLLAVAGIPIATAESSPYRAGVTRLTVQDSEPFDALVAYPTETAEGSVTDAPMTLSATRDAPIAGASAAARFPVVLFSHGSGRGGTPLLHRDLLLHLAREGFVVVAPFHSGARQPFVALPRQIRKALQLVLADRRFAARADAARVGIMGFSFGGAVTLLLEAQAPRICRDPPGVDRAAIHQRVRQEIADFLRANL